MNTFGNIVYQSRVQKSASLMVLDPLVPMELATSGKTPPNLKGIERYVQVLEQHMLTS